MSGNNTRQKHKGCIRSIPEIRISVKIHGFAKKLALASVRFDSMVVREKGRALTQSYDKSIYTHRKFQRATLKHKNAANNFDYPTIADRLRMVSWGNDSHPTGVVKPVYGIPTFPLTTKAVESKGYTFENV